MSNVLTKASVACVLCVYATAASSYALSQHLTASAESPLSVWGKVSSDLDNTQLYFHRATFDADSGQSSSSRPPAVPFALSTEIVNHCNDPVLEAGRYCKKFYDHMAQMAAESRDVAWASQMEEKLLAYLEHTSIDTSIRNIECRKTWCAIDVQTADHKLAVGFWPINNPLNRQLNVTDWEAASDSDQARKIYIVIYRRR